MQELTDDAKTENKLRMQTARNINIRVLICYYLVYVSFSIYAQLQYFADGSYFFLRILDTGTFVQFNTSRDHAHYVTQFMTVAAVKLGISNYNFLSYLFGLNLYVPQIVSLATCYYIVQKEDMNLMIFPLLSFLGLSINEAFIPFHESHVVSSAFWPVLLFAISKRKCSLTDSIMLFICVIIFMKSYESAVLLAPVLLFLSLQKVFKENLWERNLWLLVSLMLLATIIIAVAEILRPYDAGNRANFLTSILDMYGHFPALVSMLFLTIIMLCLVVPWLFVAQFKRIAIAAGLFILLFCFIPLCDPILIKPFLHMSARALISYIVPILSILCILVATGRMSVSPETWKQIWVFASILIFGQVSWMLIATCQWKGFKVLFQQQLVQNRGVVSFERSIFPQTRIGNQLVRPMTWDWTMPIMSILWAPSGDVQTIFSNPKHNAYEPIDLSKTEELPKLERFGFSFQNLRTSLAGDRQTLIFSATGGVSRYLLSGWAIPDTGQTWTLGTSAALMLDRGDHKQDPTIELDLIPFVIPEKVPYQRLTVWVNEEKVEEAVLTAPSQLRFTVPKSVWERRDKVVVWFLLPDAKSPKSLGLSQDERAIALAFKSLAIMD